MITQITQSGNIPIPKDWRKELGLKTNSKVIIDKVGTKIIIEPLKIVSVAEAAKALDEEFEKERHQIYLRRSY